MSSFYMNAFQSDFGFSFDICKRNSILEAAGFKAPNPVKTGTTVAGMVYKDGIIIGADTRATENTVVADKNSAKIHYLASNMYCGGAGTAADTVMTSQTIAAQLEMLRLGTGSAVPVLTGATLLRHVLFRYQGCIVAALVLGGCDRDGAHIYSIYPHGSIDELPFTSQGSGSHAAIGVLEERWRPTLNEHEGKLIVKDAITAGIFNDLGSGSNVDLCVVRKNGSSDYIRSYDEANVRGKKMGRYTYKQGTTSVLKSKVIPLKEVKKSVKCVYPSKF